MLDRPSRILRTSEGTQRGHFGPVEWSLLAFTSLTWGSSYLWIALGLESFSPGLIAWLRLAFGAAVLLLLRRDHTRIALEDWIVIGVIAVAGNAGPALMFALAEQTLESSVVGMLTAVTPLATLAVAYVLGNRSLKAIHVAGLGIGLIGVIMMSVDNVFGARTGVAGVVYTLLGIGGYAVTSNVIGPVAERYGSVAVILRAQILATLIMTPSGLFALGDSSFGWKSLIAVAILGIFGTGIARSVQASLIARAGAPRASIVGYLVPVVAAALGVIVLSETMTIAEVGGLALITLGAFLGSRRISAATT